MDPVKKILGKEEDDGYEQALKLESAMEKKLDKYLLERYG